MCMFIFSPNFCNPIQKMLGGGVFWFSLVGLGDLGPFFGGFVFVCVNVFVYW